MNNITKTDDSAARPSRPRYEGGTPSTLVGYCTNVHAGEDFDRYLASLQEYALDVKARVSAGRPLPIGLWLSARTARQMLNGNRLMRFKEFLESNGLVPFTMNGFPFANFHGPTVKYQVYKPDWTQPQRLNYTVNLIKILTELMPEGAQAGISTLPLGWPGGEFDYENAAGNLIRIVEILKNNEKRTGRLIHLDIEPEPGCILSSGNDVLSFFNNYLLGRYNDADVLRHLRVCHDICHASVIFEDQEKVIRNYTVNGIRIGKIHVSSALEAEISGEKSSTVLEQLKAFREDRYLHQTYIRQSDRILSYDDLPQAIGDINTKTDGTLRCHFHLPIFIESAGDLQTTNYQIADCLKSIYKLSDCRHFEVETYAWTVLPDALKTEDLARGISKELLWMQNQLENINTADRMVGETVGLRN